MDPLDLKERIGELKQAAQEILADARVSLHAILDRVDGATIYGPNKVPLITIELGKVKNAPPA